MSIENQKPPRSGDGDVMICEEQQQLFLSQLSRREFLSAAEALCVQQTSLWWATNGQHSLFCSVHVCACARVCVLGRVRET